MQASAEIYIQMDTCGCIHEKYRNKIYNFSKIMVDDSMSTPLVDKKNHKILLLEGYPYTYMQKQRGPFVLHWLLSNGSRNNVQVMGQTKETSR